MRRRPDAFITRAANRLSAVLSDIREAERCEHIGRIDEANALLQTIDTEMHSLVLALEHEMDRRQISLEYMQLRGLR